MVLTVAEAKKLTVPRLKEELAKRGLDSTGNKPDLLARLTESIHQDVEDRLLSEGGDSHLLSDDILNDDILDAPGIDGDVDADKLLGTEATPVVGETEKPDEEVEEGKKEVNTTSNTCKNIEEAQRARALRFGIPMTSKVLGSDSAKAARAKRFGLLPDSKELGSEEAKAKRAERFGTSNGGGGKPNDEVLAARAARFGLPVDGEQAQKLAARAKRFSGTGVEDEEMVAKKKARAERFGAPGK